ncbi:putative ribonuclease H-like domain-containing protein [Tanacetum coccineum]
MQAISKALQEQHSNILVMQCIAVNTVAPKSKVNDALPTTYSYFKAHSPVRRAFNQKSAAKTNNFNEKVNTTRVNNVTTARPKEVVSAAVRNRENAVKSSSCWIWRPTGNGNPQYTLQDQGIFDSGCSRHMTRNKSFLTDYQDIDGGFVAFARCAKGGTGPNWLFDINTLTMSMNYQPIFAGNQSNGHAGITKNIFPKSSKDEVANDARKKNGVLDPAKEDDKKSVKEDTADLLNTGIFSGAYDDEDVGAEADLNNLEKHLELSTYSNKPGFTRIHPKDANHKGPLLAPKLARMNKSALEHAQEPKKVTQALTDPSWIEAMQDELLQFRLQKVWRLVDLPKGKHANCYTQEEGIDYDEVFAPVARIEAISIEEEVYVCQPPGFEDPWFPNQVYKVEKALYGLHQAPKAWYETLSTYLLENRFRRGTIDKTLFIKKDKVKTASTPIETNKALLKHKEAEDVDVHLYRSMIGSLMYLTASRPDIMFAVCAYARFQVTPKVSHLYAMKRIFRYLKGQPKLGLWYPRDSPFDLEAFSDSDYAGVSLDRKSTTGGCQFLGKRLISWQCQKKTIVANSTTEAEYVAAANYCGQVTELPQTSEPIPNVADEDVYEETKSTAIPNVPLPQGIGAYGSPRCQEATRGPLLRLDDEEDLEDYSKQGRMIEEIDQDAGVTLVTPTHVNTAGASMPVSTAGTVQEVNINIPSSVVIKDKGKGIMDESEEEQSKRTKLQQEQDRLGHEAAEEWKNIRARVEADEELTRRLQAEERNKYSKVDQAKMLVDLINQRKRYFATQKAEAKRKKPMTQAQQRNYMMNYTSPWKLKELFETTMKNVNTFVPTETEDRGRASELAAGSSQATITDSAEVRSSKRGVEVGLDHEGSKKQKTNEASESVVLVKEVYVEALQVKYPIIDWEVYSEDTRRDDLVKLWDLVKERFSTTEPIDDKEKELWVELKRLFELDSDDTL